MSSLTIWQHESIYMTSCIQLSAPQFVSWPRMCVLLLHFTVKHVLICFLSRYVVFSSSIRMCIFLMLGFVSQKYFVNDLTTMTKCYKQVSAIKLNKSARQGLILILVGHRTTLNQIFSFIKPQLVILFNRILHTGSYFYSLKLWNELRSASQKRIDIPF